MFAEGISKVSRGRGSGSSNREFQEGSNLPADDDNLFWMNIENEYFGKIDDRMRDILKFHIHSTEYILNIINSSASPGQEGESEKTDLLLEMGKAFGQYSSASMELGGLRSWNRVVRELNGEGFGLFDSGEQEYDIREWAFQDSTGEEGQKRDNQSEGGLFSGCERSLKKVKLSLSVPPLNKPADFPKELTHCKSVREILHTLAKIQCTNKYTRLNSNRSLYSILDDKEEVRDLSGTCNYICLIPDIISGPSVEWNLPSESELISRDESYNFNSVSEEWIFNINNKLENMRLRKSLLDTSHLLPFNNYKADVVERPGAVSKAPVMGELMVEEGSNLLKTILGTGDTPGGKEGGRMDPNALIPLVDLEKDLSEESTLNRIKRAKSFGDFFQENLHISPNRPLDPRDLDGKEFARTPVEHPYRYPGLSSIINSESKIDFDLNMEGSMSNSAGASSQSAPRHDSMEFKQSYLNREASERELTEVSFSLIKRLKEISVFKLEMFKRILARVEDERQPDPGYWCKKEFELNNYYRKEQHGIGYNYTLERQAKDLEKFRLVCIESRFLPSEWQETALCSICGNDTDWDEDPIYFCDGCYQPAHHSCVNPKQPFRYNSTRMLNVLEREQKCQQGDLEGSKPKDGEADEDGQWLCDVCLDIKSQLLDHQYLFFALVRMASGPRDSRAVEHILESIQSNLDPFLGQLIAYNAISSSLMDKSIRHPIVFPWIRDWVLPEIAEEDPDAGEPEENKSNFVVERRRKGRPRKAPLLSLTTLRKSGFHYFTFEFSDFRDSEDETHLFDWNPTNQTPYNYANFPIFKKQIFDPVRWYNKLESRRKLNQTPPVSLASQSSESDSEQSNPIIQQFPEPALLEVFKHDQLIIEKLEERRIIRREGESGVYKVRIRVPVCQLCGYDAFCRSGGIMKKTVDGFWAHIRCALGNCSVLSSDGNYLRIRVDLQKNKIKCEGCGKVDCSPILCHNSQCCISFHINCASSRKDCIVDWENGKPLLYCPEHSSNIAPTILLQL
ncbi:PHD-finger domain-containing protein [Cryptosporidium felis]|nr:PHD-finger domain-containing protein [Cryptosporidium felis]